MDKDVTRRDALKLAAGAAALGAALGVSRSALAMEARGEPATELGEKIFFKFYYSGKFWHTVELTDEQAAQLQANPSALTVKISRASAENVGTLSLTPEVQQRLRAFVKGAR